MTPKLTPGRRLLVAMDKELQRAGEEAGHTLEWSEPELAALQVAANAADQITDLQDLYRRERAGQSRPATLAKLSSEIRGQQRTLLDALGRLKFDPDHISKVRRRASRARWGVDGQRHA